jgi:hypothetical protein
MTEELPKPATRSGRYRAVLHWAGLLLPVLSAFLGLYATLFLLQIVRLAPDLKRFDFEVHTMNLSLQRAQMFSDYNYELHGQAPRPRMWVEVGVNEHLLDTASSDPDGNFEVPIYIPLQTNRVWARAIDPESGQTLATDQINFSWDQALWQPSLQVAYAATKTGVLWIAGSATPDAWIRLEDENGQYLTVVHCNSTGGFDALLPLVGSGPSYVTARPSNPDGPVSLPLTVSTIEQLPLSRQAEFDLNASHPRLDLKVDLPTEHPSFQSLVQGYMSAAEFLDSVFGLRGAGYELEVTHTLSILPESGGLRMGRVNITGTWRYPIPEIRVYRSPIYPLMSAKDSIVLNFNGVQPAWINPPLPTSLLAAQASWRGPVDPGDSRHAVQVGLALPPGVQAYRPPEQVDTAQAAAEDQRQQEEQLKMREFIRSFETRSSGSLGAATWRTLILLIPYAALFWLWRQGHFGRPGAWRPLVATIIVLSVWRIWGYLYNLLQRGPGLWLQRAITPLRYWLNLGGTQSQYVLLGDASSNAYWLLFLGFLALVPLYLPALEQALAKVGEPAPQRQPARAAGLRRAWLGMRILFGALVLALIVVIIQLRPEQLIFYSAEPPLPVALIRQALQAVRDNYSVAYLYQENPQWLAVALTTLAALFLLAWDWSAGLFGLGLTAVTLRAALAAPITSSDLGLPVGFAEQVARTPWWVFLALAAALAYPLVLRLLRILTPLNLPGEQGRPGFRRLRAPIAAGLVLLSFLLPYTPARPLLVAAGALLLIALGYLAFYGLRNLGTISHLPETLRRQPWVLVLVGVVILAIAWPITAPGATDLSFSSLGSLMGQADNLFVFILALSLVLLLRDEAATLSSGAVFTGPVLQAGIVLFAVFLINSSTSWLFIPVPFLVGLLVARVWLFRPQAEILELQPVLMQASRERKTLIQDILDQAGARDSYEKILSALKKKFEAAELSDQEYREKIAAYQAYFGERLSLEEHAPGLTSKKIAFAVGEADPWTNTRWMLGIGALLALLPLLVALYEYLPTSRVAYPYPLAALLVFLLSATASWLLYAFFFGYFYVHLRGSNGLSKGLVLFFGLVLPFSAYRLLSAQTLEEMRSFLIWGTQIFLFCTILGLLGVEYRLIRQHGYRLRDLLAVHNLPALSVYASSVVAALAPTVIAILTGRLNEVVKFFLETVLPRIPSGGP